MSLKSHNIYQEEKRDLFPVSTTKTTIICSRGKTLIHIMLKLFLIPLKSRRTGRTNSNEQFTGRLFKVAGSRKI